MAGGRHGRISAVTLCYFWEGGKTTIGVDFFGLGGTDVDEKEPLVGTPKQIEDHQTDAPTKVDTRGKWRSSNKQNKRILETGRTRVYIYMEMDTWNGYCMWIASRERERETQSKKHREREREKKK